MSSTLKREIRAAAGRVLLDPRRLAFLLRGGVAESLDLAGFLTGVVPLAKAELAQIEILAQRIPDGELRKQALSSLHAKAYHVAGACILATFLPSEARKHYVEIVAPLESIYDFLDCLADRIPETTPQAIRQLHRALEDALDPRSEMADYYRYGPGGEDGGYLAALVLRTRHSLERLGEHAQLVPCFREAARLYTDHQAIKHTPPDQRNAALAEWHRTEADGSGDLHWWEFAAATGSQFQVYGPLYAAFCGDFDQIASAYNAYFPEFAALHVLFDSFIDRFEDAQHGELNWLSCYDSSNAFAQRAGALARRARERLDMLRRPHVHRFALRIMALFYMTHPKVFDQKLDREATAVLDALA